MYYLLVVTRIQYLKNLYHNLRFGYHRAHYVFHLYTMELFIKSHFWQLDAQLNAQKNTFCQKYVVKILLLDIASVIFFYFQLPNSRYCWKRFTAHVHICEVKKNKHSIAMFRVEPICNFYFRYRFTNKITFEQ